MKTLFGSERIPRMAGTYGIHGVYKIHGRVKSTAKNLFQNLVETNPLCEQLRQCGGALL
jgi:hypothetical protein